MTTMVLDAAVAKEQQGDLVQRVTPTLHRHALSDAPIAPVG